MISLNLDPLDRGFTLRDVYNDVDVVDVDDDDGDDNIKGEDGRVHSYAE